MRFVRTFAAIAAVAALALAVQPASARSATSEDYIGTFDPITYGQCKGSRIPENIGMVCFPVESGDKFVDVTSSDVAFGTTGMFYIFVDQTGRCVGDSDDPTESCPNDGFICGAISGLPVPGKAVGLRIYALGTLGTTNCTVLDGSDTVGAATAGTITTKFRSS